MEPNCLNSSKFTFSCSTDPSIKCNVGILLIVTTRKVHFVNQPQNLSTIDAHSYAPEGDGCNAENETLC